MGFIGYESNTAAIIYRMVAVHGSQKITDILPNPDKKML